MVGLLAGIVLEVIGFSLRVRISGWAPVTNMYETVIWVSLVSAVLGLVFELIYRKTFAALAGSGVALLGTVLAANVPLLDPGIQRAPAGPAEQLLAGDPRPDGGLQLRAPSPLAMGLGLIATVYYLTATYRRSPSYRELGMPALPGLPMLALGTVGLAASYGAFGPRLAPGSAETLFYVAATLAALGGVGTIVGLGGMAGEAIARALFRERADPRRGRRSTASRPTRRPRRSRRSASASRGGRSRP